MSTSPKKPRKLPPRPKIKLPVPGQFPGHYPQTPMGYVTTPYGQTPVPLTPVSGQPTIVYPAKSSGFVFAHFKGFKDWTKSGLSVGEKSAFWLYEKFLEQEMVHAHLPVLRALPLQCPWRLPLRQHRGQIRGSYPRGHQEREGRNGPANKGLVQRGRTGKRFGPVERLRNEQDHAVRGEALPVSEEAQLPEPPGPR